MAYRSPNFPTIVPRSPQLLETTVRKLVNRDMAYEELEAPAELRREAHDLVAREMRAPNLPFCPRRLITPMLMEIGEGDHGQQWEQKATQLLLSSPMMFWRRKWVLWQTAQWTSREVAASFAEGIAAYVARKPGFRSQLPPWIAEFTSASDLVGLMADPTGRTKCFAESTSMDVRTFNQDVVVSLHGSLGTTCLLHLIREGSDSWWSEQDARGLRNWAKQLEHGDILMAVAERQLLFAGRGATNAAALKTTPDMTLLAHWAMQAISDPTVVPAAWEGINPRARNILEWILLAETLQEILREFSRYATDSRRAVYWAGKFHRLKDARFYNARESGVCLMVLGKVLVVDFGTTSNACYFYKWNESCPPLRALPIEPGERVAFFKKYLLVLAGHRFEQIDWMAHSGAWESKFDSCLRLKGA